MTTMIQTIIESGTEAQAREMLERMEVICDGSPEMSRALDTARLAVEMRHNTEFRVMALGHCEAYTGVA